MLFGDRQEPGRIVVSIYIKRRGTKAGCMLCFTLRITRASDMKTPFRNELIPKSCCSMALSSWNGRVRGLEAEKVSVRCNHRRSRINRENVSSEGISHTVSSSNLTGHRAIPNLCTFERILLFRTASACWPSIPKYLQL
jgi:hypothetical protein